jgi:hypothetical protein
MRLPQQPTRRRAKKYKFLLKRADLWWPRPRLNDRHRSARARLLILGCRMHLDESTITTGDSTFLNERLQLLYRIERRLQQHIELSEYQEAFLQACEE